MDIKTFEEITKTRDFEIEDTFNDNTLRGLISVAHGGYYGSLLITHINDVEVPPQFIQGTPKIRYPFNKNGVFEYPEFTQVRFFSKLDGTNILAFGYEFDGEFFITYKTRLTPIVQETKFGNFRSMWLEILERYPRIPYLVSPRRSVSFEIWGALNKHLILYPVRLEASLLFFIDRATGDILPPDIVDLGIPIPELYRTLPSECYNFEKEYQRLREDLENENFWEGEDLVGSEGSVAYLREADTGKWSLFKCKPETVSSIHMRPGLSKKDILITCQNALEAHDELTFEAVKELLLEEITEFEVEQRQPLIEECIKYVIWEQKFIAKIVEDYRLAKEATGETIISDKGAIMRWLSARFEKREMQTVFSYVSALEN